MPDHLVVPRGGAPATEAARQIADVGAGSRAHEAPQEPAAPAQRAQGRYAAAAALSSPADQASAMSGPAGLIGMRSLRGGATGCLLFRSTADPAVRRWLPGSVARENSQRSAGPERLARTSAIEYDKP
ncbi:MAG: hypothetical protein R2853_15445 [Thermomicrobiales bacterium]